MKSQVERLIADIENDYKITVKSLLELYSKGLPREDIAETLKTSLWNVRVIMNLLNLRSPKKHRANDLARFYERYSTVDGVTSKLTDEVKELNEDLRFLTKHLETKDKTIISLRSQLKVSKMNSNNSTINDTIREIMSNIPNTINVYPMDKVVMDYTEGTFMITLSDLHFDEMVRSQDTTKEFNWEIAKRRLENYFSLALEKAKGEQRLVICLLGDLLSGTIHGAQETASKPIVEATSELAILLTQQVAYASQFFDMTEVYCVNGNHERLTDKPSKFAKSYDYSYFLYNFMKSALSTNPSINVIISTNGYNIVPLGGNRNMVAHHGDIHRDPIGLNRTLKIKEIIKQTFGVDTHVQLQGHLHQLDIRSFGEILHISCPSFIGVGNFSHTTGLLGTPASQLVLRWDAEGELVAMHNIILDRKEV